MTGGVDSRTVFSALVYAKVEFKAFTLLLDDERSIVDAKIAEALCNEFGIYHESIGPEFSKKEELEIFLEHTGGCGGDRADKYVIGNYYRKLPDDVIVLHGGAFEIGQRIYETSFKNFDFFDLDRTVADLEKVFSENFTEKEADAIKEWLNYRKMNPIVGVDMIDSFFIDQRRAGWGAANRQAEDCFSFDWLVFANSWRLISLLLSVSEDVRRKKAIQQRAMDILLPGIVKIEHINPRLNYFKIIKKLGIRRSTKRILKVISRKISIIYDQLLK